ncbi:M23 family metallopeptidase [Endozoicomonas sp. SM1973]|uniref:M23 family metallopeptidase n=1 Tax=Spartinivicinus marinus TaxID=2994442 RepID=A0A853I7X1_9GAMM|nr:M23 family metallopeptidase [Spartinivicinus marinus]MCX4028322.1 M23 family metallopeptidase [Spartinivicinus marinus]NYZ65657.1 M23 family metallopeptidase [Spartinivicinus marinus]
MNIIIVRRKLDRSRTFHIGPFGLTFLVLALLIALISLSIWGTYTYLTPLSAKSLSNQTTQHWQGEITSQRRELSALKDQATAELDALALRVSELQSRLVRLDALGERLTQIADLDNGEFDFSEPPGLGGPESNDIDETFKPPQFIDLIDQLIKQIDNREAQLELLGDLITSRKIKSDVLIAGSPIRKGWLSSRFGRRTDPINGRYAWHKGIDFAGKYGSGIFSVGSGVITWAGSRGGYGNMVEVNHGNGFVTRYAHNSKVLVKVGDLVKKGQRIALMGSSGRATGPHVHFEVYKDGKAVNPARYISRANG